MTDSTHDSTNDPHDGEHDHTPFDDQGVTDGAPPEELPGAEDLPVDDEEALREREVNAPPAIVVTPLQDRIH